MQNLTTKRYFPHVNIHVWMIINMSRCGKLLPVKTVLVY